MREFVRLCAQRYTPATEQERFQDDVIKARIKGSDIPKMRCILVHLIIALVVTLAGCKGKPAAVASQSNQHLPNGNLPDWTFQQSDAASVAAVRQMRSFSIRPPADFQFIKEVDEPKTITWAGPIRPNQTYPIFVVIIQKLPHPNPYSSMDAMWADVLNGIQVHATNWSAKPVEHGIIHGFQFMRTSWSGVANSTVRKELVGKGMHGIVYLAVIDDNIIQIMCEDEDPDYAQWLKRAEAAASTFQVAAADAAPGPQSEAMPLMPVYITPFYDSNGPRISVGPQSKALETADGKTILQISNQLKQQRDQLRAEVMYVLAIQLYDLGQKDEAVYWFYTAQYRARVFEAILADPKPGSKAFELKQAYDSFNQLAGTYLNGYAFGDLPALQKTLAKVMEEGTSLPKYGDLYPEFSFGPPEEYAEKNAAISLGLSELSKYIQNNADQIKEQRKQTGVEGKY
jgi:hypothetical protein